MNILYGSVNNPKLTGSTIFTQLHFYTHINPLGLRNPECE